MGPARSVCSASRRWLLGIGQKGGPVPAHPARLLSCPHPLGLIPGERMCWRLCGFAFLILVTIHPAWSQAGTPLACEMPPGLVTPSGTLTNATAALTAKDDLNILALGSGSTVGDSTGLGGPALAFHNPERSYPYQMLAALRSI